MYDVIVIGAGISGAAFSCKASKYAKVLVIESKDENKIPKTTNVFPLHNKPFIEEIDWSDKVIFPSLHKKTNYMGYEEHGIIDSDEFSGPLGNVVYLENLIKKLVDIYKQQGGTILYGEKVKKVSRKSESIEVYTDKGQSYTGKILAIATGSYNFELQKSLGFNAPDSFTGVFMHLYGDEDKIKDNNPYDYIYHINSKISKKGPLFINRGVERAEVGFLGNPYESPEEILSKLDKVQKNYKNIQPFIQGLKRINNPTVIKISKHPIKQLTQDRILILGEAGGLVTDFFYEGTLCGVCSAHIASQTLESLFENDTKFTRNELIQYEKELDRILLEKYFKNGNASEYLFYSIKGYTKKVWDTYAKLIRTSPRLRKEIWEAYRTQNLEDYDIKRTRWAGERLYRMLPTLTKVALLPKFVKSFFK